MNFFIFSVSGKNATRLQHSGPWEWCLCCWCLRIWQYTSRYGYCLPRGKIQWPSQFCWDILGCQSFQGTYALSSIIITYALPLFVLRAFMVTMPHGSQLSMVLPVQKSWNHCAKNFSLYAFLNWDPGCASGKIDGIFGSKMLTTSTCVQNLIKIKSRYQKSNLVS